MNNSSSNQKKIKPNKKKQPQKSETHSTSSKAPQLFQSLVKYDTPYLVSTTLNNKKTLDEMELKDEKLESLLNSIFKKENSSTEQEGFSVKDALNIILPPKKIITNDQLWVQYVSCTPVTKAEVQNLKEGLEKRVKALDAKDTGICLIREQLYSEFFDELIRQVTINCLERGILMILVKREYENQLKFYQNLYHSSIANGIRSQLIEEKDKNEKSDEIEKMKEEIEILEKDINLLENEYEETKRKDEEVRKEVEEQHGQNVRLKLEEIEGLKNELISRQQRQHEAS